MTVRDGAKRKGRRSQDPSLLPSLLDDLFRSTRREDSLPHRERFTYSFVHLTHRHELVLVNNTSLSDPYTTHAPVTNPPQTHQLLIHHTRTSYSLTSIYSSTKYQSYSSTIRISPFVYNTHLTIHRQYASHYSILPIMPHLGISSTHSCQHIPIGNSPFL